MHPQIINIVLLKKELLHDIEAETTRIERAAQPTAQSAAQNASLPHPILSDDDAYSVSREIDKAFNTALSRIQAYLTIPAGAAHHVTTNHAHDWQERAITLALPHNWPPHCLEPLRDAVHTYIVKSVVLAILSPSFTDDKAIPLIAQQQERAYNDINALVNSRIGPLRIHPTFLG